MENQVVISTKLNIPGEYLTPKLSEAIVDKLNEKYLGTCSQEYGYILEILRVIEQGPNIISSITSMPIFSVKFEARILKPAVGQRVEGVVFTVRDNFIIVSIKDKVNVLVNKAELNKSGFIYNKTGVCFKSASASIRQGDIVSVEITSVKYKKDYVCIGNGVKTQNLEVEPKKKVVKKVVKRMSKKSS